MRIGIFGGSFDPPHRGHLAVSRAGLAVLRLDAVWWLVSPHNPLKPQAPSDDLARRVAAAAAIARDPRVAITAVEAALGTTWTAETLARLLPALPGCRVVWMMGADSLASFHRWRDWQSIAASVPIAVFNRPGEALKALASPAAKALQPARIPERLAGRLADMAPPAWVFLSRPSVAVSSTALRAGRKRALS
jgi:nicotinate-nucleotide adenylyltransferase